MLEGRVLGNPSKCGTPILVVSCDKYSDLWRPFFEIFWKRWPDCPYPVYLGSNFKTYQDERVTPINIGDDISWTSGVRQMLRHINAEYFILFLEDFLIKQRVNTEAVDRLVRVARERQLGCLRLSPLPPPTPLPAQPIADLPDLGVVLPGDAYRVSTQPAVWRISTLQRLLLPGFSAWEFESIGSQLSSYMPDVFWGPYQFAIVYDHGVEKGKWKPQGLSICRQAGVEVDLDERSAFSEHELQTHNMARKKGSKQYEMKSTAIKHFLDGQRLQGFWLGLHYLRTNPIRLQSWAILLFGLLGSRSISWLQKQHLRLKVVKARWKDNRMRANRSTATSRCKS